MKIKDLNLYGRMIYGVNCLIKYWKMLNVEFGNDEVKFLLSKFIKYTNTDFLDDWQDDILPLLPMCIFEAVDESGHSICRPQRCSNYNAKNESCALAKKCEKLKNMNRNPQEQKMYEFYLRIDDDFLAILDLLYNIGASELYGKPTDMKESELYLTEIVNILKNHNFDIPKINDFKEFILHNPKKDIDYYGAKVDTTDLLDLL